VGREDVGEAIEIALPDVVIQWLGDTLAPLLHSAAAASPDRRFLGESPGYGTYRTKDGKYMAVGAEESKFWRALTERLGRPDLSDSNPLATEDEGKRLRAALAECFAARTRKEWEQVFADDAVPCDPVLDPAEIPDSDYVRVREMLVKTETIEGDELAIPGFPIKFANRPCVERRRAPAHGEDNRDLLGRE
jgi:crotonobetainyl-CoA:carnitine CoA-transferase CaiB-like acyl-CoA transferase